MGLPSLPRLYFKGQFYWAPSTYNNNDKAPALETYDPTTAKLDWSYLREQGVNNDEEFKEWSIKNFDCNPDPDITLPPAEWGYYGGNQSGFVTKASPVIRDDNFSIPLGVNRSYTETTGFTSDKIRYDCNDAWVGLPLQFNLNFKPAKLVDINPTLPWTSQVFSDNFTIADSAKKEGFTAPVKYRMHSRWLYTNRNYNTDGKMIIAGVISTFFQTVVHKEDIKFFNSKPKKNSYQAQLQKGLEKADGIMIRFTAYDTIYFQGKSFENLHTNGGGSSNPEEELEMRIAILYQKYEEQLKAYNEGRITEKPVPPVNRAYSRVVGWTGLWHKDEMISMAEGRTLLPTLLPGQPKGLPTPQPVQAKGLPPSFYSSDNNRAAVSIGPVNVGVKEKNGEVERITVDMGTAMPELNSTGMKADFGEVVLKVIDLNAKTKKSRELVIGKIKNNIESYQKTAGVFDFAGLSEKVKKLILHNPLALYVDSYDNKTGKQTPTLALIENPVMSNTNSRGVYVNQPDPYWESETPDVNFTIKVQYYGKPPAKDEVQIAIGQYTSGFVLIDEKTPSKGSKQFEYQTKPFVELSYQGKAIDNGTNIPVPADGLVKLDVKALQPGMPFLVFYPFVKDSGFTGPSNFQHGEAAAVFYSYNAIRSLPFDNILAEEFEQWLGNLFNPNSGLTVSSYHDVIGRVNQRVFDDVFRTFHLMYPVMGFIGCPMQFQGWRGRILKLTDPKEFNSAAYMPVTRSLSAGQRRILVAYTDFLGKLPQFDVSSADLSKVHDFNR